MLPHCGWAPLSLGNWPRTCSSSCLFTNLTHLCLAWWAEAEQECGSTLPQGEGEQPVSAPRTGTAPAFSATSAGDLLKRGQKRGWRPACRAGLQEEQGPRGTWLGLAACLCVCLPPCLPVHQPGPGLQEAFLEHRRPPSCALSGVRNPLVLLCLPH